VRIVTWNVNGMRAALRKSFSEHLDALEPDVVLLQEIRARPEQLPAPWRAPPGWHVAWHPAERPGYAGTAVWSRTPLEAVHVGLAGAGADAPDAEGRVLRVRTGGVEVVSVYLPSGSASPESQARKEAWMADFLPWAGALASAGHPVVLGGDLNIAHTESDIHNAKSNANNSGFLPHERAWFGELLAAGWRDTLREAVGAVQGPYTWWSNRGQARAKDRGWRIDYLLANGAVAVAGAGVRREGGLDTSDHAPSWVDVSAG
jgi:exodeoxyribonuclease-3